MKYHRLLGLIKDNKGTAVLESAIALPLILFLGASILEYGFYFAQIQAAQAGLTDAVRYLTRVQYTGDPNSSLNQNTISFAQEMAKKGACNFLTQTSICRAFGLDTASNPTFNYLQISNSLGLYSGTGNIYIANGSWTFTLYLVPFLNKVPKNFTIQYQQKMMNG